MRAPRHFLRVSGLGVCKGRDSRNGILLAKGTVPMRHTPTVLIVDDDASSVKLLTVVLHAAGCDVRVAATAEEALETLRSFRPTVALIDLILPLMSGLTLAQRLKADPVTAGIALIAVTSFNGPEAERTAIDAGYSKYVRKPIDPTSIAELILGTEGSAP